MVLGGEEAGLNKGFPQMMDALEVGRVNVAARGVGIAQRALELALRYSQERSAFGKPIAQHQAIQFKLADMATKVEAARLLTLKAARMKDAGERSDLEAGMAKLFASEAGKEVVEDSFRIHGGYGYSKEYEIERLYRDAPLLLIGEGTSEIQRMVIGRTLLRRHKICALRIEDYAVVGDTQTAALVGRDGSIDWLCLPRFDSPACFAALLGDRRNGRWQIAPAGEITKVERRYRDDTLVLETDLYTRDGAIRLVDCMPPRGEAPDIVRLVQGLEGRVEVEMELILRFDYGSVVPVGAPPRRLPARDRRARRGAAGRRRRDARREPDDARVVRRQPRRRGAVRAHLVPVASSRARARRCGAVRRGHLHVVARVDRRLPGDPTRSSRRSCSRSRRSRTRRPAGSSPP